MQEAYSSLKDVEAWLRRMKITFKGHDLSERDNATFVGYLTLQSALLCDLFPETSLTDQLRRWKGWIMSTPALDVYDFGRFIRNVSMHLRRLPELYESGTKMSRQAFKQLVPEPTFWGFVSPVWAAIDSLCENPNWFAMQMACQWVDFGIKLNLTSVDCQTELIEEYKALEQDYPDQSAIVPEIKPILAEWFEGFSLANAFPQHGPRSTFEVRRSDACIQSKELAQMTDVRLEFGRKVGLKTDYSWNPTFCSDPHWRTSRLVCVPKSMVTNRTISAEPTSLQFYQQQVKNALYDWSRSNRTIHRRIDFSDQEKSKQMAREGSIFGDFATIDLSSASDLVGWDLVKRSFPYQLVCALACTRSDCTMLPDGSEIRLKKFAPMGSACCFPIESLVFAAICERARRNARSRKLFRVFGDDIVVPREYAEETIRLLESGGFIVNRRKSFWTGTLYCFREACGGEYFQCREVTPMRISRWWYLDDLSHHTPTTPRRKPSGDQIDMFVGLMNQAFDHGLMHVRAKARELFEGIYGYKWLRLVPFSTDGTIGLKTYPQYCTNYHLDTRYNRDYHRCEARYLSRAIDAGASDDDIRYFEWLRSRSMPNDYSYHWPEGFVVADPRVRTDTIVRVSPSRSRVVTRWSLLRA